MCLHYKCLCIYIYKYVEDTAIARPTDLDQECLHARERFQVKRHAGNTRRGYLAQVVKLVTSLVERKEREYEYMCIFPFPSWL